MPKVNEKILYRDNLIENPLHSLFAPFFMEIFYSNPASAESTIVVTKCLNAVSPYLYVEFMTVLDKATINSLMLCYQRFIFLFPCF